MTTPGRALPKPLDAVAVQHGVVAEDRYVLGDALRDEEMAEWIAMVLWKL